MTATTTVPTLTAGGTKVFASSNSNILTLYGVQSESISKSANLIDFPMPTSDSDSRIEMDLLGTSREITVEGIVTINDVANLYKYSNDLAGILTTAPSPGNTTLIYGAQGSNGGQVGYLYTSELLNRGNTGTQITVRVYINDIKINNEAGNVNSFKYSISMVECSGTSSA